MNTTGIQNYLSNVFRPIVSYNPTTSNFIPKLEMSNIDTYSGNIVSVFRADVGDSNFNVYVGNESGNSLVDIRSCSNVSAFGYAAGNGISNDLNSVYVGYRAGAGNIATRSIIGIGSGAGGGGIGLSNIFIGTNTKSATGSRNIFLGHGIDLSSVSDQIRIGYGNKMPIAADTSRNWVGLGGVLTPTNASSSLDVSGNTYIRGALDVSGITRSTGGYCSIQSNVVPSSTSTVIGEMKKGFIFVSAVDSISQSNNAASIFFSATGTTAFTYTVYSTSNGNTSILLLSGSNITIQDTTLAVYDYNITYFPLL
jgi:hypothetical protein